MEYFKVESKPRKDHAPLVLVIGKFDGVHRGHLALLDTAQAYMKEKEQLAVMSFSDHPRWILLHDEAFQKSLTPLEQQLSLLNQHGVDRFYHIQFTKEYASITAELFVNEHLSQLNIKTIVVGEDFHFGKGGAASVEDLKMLCKPYHIEVIAVPLVKVNDDKVSSTTIRSLVVKGEMEDVHQLLGRPYSVRGTVIHGEALGRKLGFPTINLGGESKQYVMPKPGVYLGSVQIFGEGYDHESQYTLISTGYRPTVDDSERYLIEAYILDFSGDLYDRKVELAFLSYLRPELKFDCLDDLVKQMKLDEINARELIEELEG